MNLYAVLIGHVVKKCLLEEFSPFGTVYIVAVLFCTSQRFTRNVVDCVWNVMAHAHKPDFVFRRNGRVHLYRRGRQFSRLLAAEVCASAVVMLDTPCSEVVWRVLATHSIRQFILHLPSRVSPCAITFQTQSTSLYHWDLFWMSFDSYFISQYRMLWNRFALKVWQYWTDTRVTEKNYKLGKLTVISFCITVLWERSGSKFFLIIRIK
jgi:hypothetical protein